MRLVNVLLLTGVDEELQVFLKDHPCTFSREWKAYRSKSHPNLFAATTGPGLRKRRAIERLLEFLVPEVIINAGLVGVLRAEAPYAAGDRIRIGTVISDANSIVYPDVSGSVKGATLISVRAPVFHPAEKLDLAENRHAEVCDMEAGPLLGLVSRPAGWRPFELRVVFCKVAGDLPADAELFRHEHRTRGWQRFSFWRKVWVGLTFPGGPLALRRLLHYRGNVLSGFGNQLRQTVKAVLESDGSTDTQDSVFRPQ